MRTQLDEKKELMNKIEILSVSDIQKVKVFIAGMEAEKIIRDCKEEKELQVAAV